MIFNVLVDTLNRIRLGEADFSELPKVFLDATAWDSSFYLSLIRFHPSAVLQLPPECISIEMINALFTSHPVGLDYLPMGLRTFEVCTFAVKSDITQIVNVPVNIRSDILISWIKSDIAFDPVSFQGIPDELRTSEACIAAVREKLISEIESDTGFYRDDFQRIPVELRTSEVCVAAVKSNADIILDISIEMHSAELCAEFVQSMGDSDLYFEDLPERLRTKKMCVACVPRSGYLRDVPIEHRDYAICLASVKDCGGDLESVPDVLRSREICDTAVLNDGLALEWVPDVLRTIELCERAVTNNGYALEFVPTTVVTVELCRLALSSSPNAIFYIPEGLVTAEWIRQAALNEKLTIDAGRSMAISDQLWFKLLSENGDLLKYMNGGRKTVEFSSIAVHSKPEAIAFVPIAHQTKEIADCVIEKLEFESVSMDARSLNLCYAAILKNGTNLRLVPPALMSKEICIFAVTKSNKHSGKALKHVPLEWKTPDLLRAAMSHDCIALRYLDADLRDLDLCQIAYDASKRDGKDVMDLIPAEYRPLLT